MLWFSTGVTATCSRIPCVRRYCFAFNSFFYDVMSSFSQAKDTLLYSLLNRQSLGKAMVLYLSFLFCRWFFRIFSVFCSETSPQTSGAHIIWELQTLSLVSAPQLLIISVSTLDTSFVNKLITILYDYKWKYMMEQCLWCWIDT